MPKIQAKKKTTSGKRTYWTPSVTMFMVKFRKLAPQVQWQLREGAIRTIGSPCQCPITFLVEQVTPDRYRYHVVDVYDAARNIGMGQAVADELATAADNLFTKELAGVPVDPAYIKRMTRLRKRLLKCCNLA